MIFFFQTENKKFSSKYHFAVQGTDIHNRCGPFSDPFLIVYPWIFKIPLDDYSSDLSQK